MIKGVRDSCKDILERVLNHMKKEVSDEQCRELNKRLTQIAK